MTCPDADYQAFVEALGQDAQPARLLPQPEEAREAPESALVRELKLRRAGLARPAARVRPRPGPPCDVWCLPGTSACHLQQASGMQAQAPSEAQTRHGRASRDERADRAGRREAEGRRDADVSGRSRKAAQGGTSRRSEATEPPTAAAAAATSATPEPPRVSCQAADTLAVLMQAVACLVVHIKGMSAELIGQSRPATAAAATLPLRCLQQAHLDWGRPSACPAGAVRRSPGGSLHQRRARPRRRLPHRAQPSP